MEPECLGKLVRAGTSKCVLAVPRRWGRFRRTFFTVPQFWERISKYTMAHDCIQDVGVRLDAYVEEIHRAASWPKSLPTAVLQGLEGERMQCSERLRRTGQATHDERAS